MRAWACMCVYVRECLRKEKRASFFSGLFCSKSVCAFSHAHGASCNGKNRVLSIFVAGSLLNSRQGNLLIGFWVVHDTDCVQRGGYLTGRGFLGE